ncbi:hypothetical protein V6N12_044952 [Hibiscus sabdariffa]|uniref:Uncharacterized protein n=1 Tax=Hibiscus sabdariffa TaxID=183260 RepID=A0ABR2G1C6_9ROSI
MIGVGRWLLLKFPSFFSFRWFQKTGPSEEEVRSASFKMWFVGYGFSDNSLASELNLTPDMQIITRGGVYTPGIVFGPDLQERLQENGVSFDLVSKTVLRGPTAA